MSILTRMKQRRDLILLFHRLKYVKSAKAATDVPTTVRASGYYSLSPDSLLDPGSRVHLAASPLVERFSVRRCSCHRTHVQNLDFWAEFLPQDHPAARVYIQRRSARVHLDVPG